MTPCYPTLIFSLFFSMLNTYACCSHNITCPALLQEDFIKNSSKVVETLKQDKDFQSFLTHSFEQRDAALEDLEFQGLVTDLRVQAPLQTSQHKSKAGSLYIFVSFSLGEKALLNLAQHAKAYGATLALRGFIEGSYAKTVQALQNIILKTGEGFIIDPDLFSLFSITAVPTYVLAKPFQLAAQTRTQTPLHDRLMGHVSIAYALESFAKSGDLTEEAQTLLDKRGSL